MNIFELLYSKAFTTAAGNAFPKQQLTELGENKQWLPQIPLNADAGGSDNISLKLKKSIKPVKDEVLSDEAAGRIRSKVDRLLDLGALAQAEILDNELRLRAKLARVQEWDYPVLRHQEIEKYQRLHLSWDGRFDSYIIHIKPLETYKGTSNSAAEAKNNIIPDHVLDELEKARDRQVFDKFYVLQVKKEKDPLLLGSIDGCKDYFLIAEWGDDISFDDISSAAGKF